MNHVKLMSGPWGHSTPAVSLGLGWLCWWLALAWGSRVAWGQAAASRGAKVCAGGLPVAWELCASSAPLVLPCARAPGSPAEQPALAAGQYSAGMQTSSASSYLNFVLPAFSLAGCCSSSRSWSIILPVLLSTALTGEVGICSQERFCVSPSCSLSVQPLTKMARETNASVTVDCSAQPVQVSLPCLPSSSPALT